MTNNALPNPAERAAQQKEGAQALVDAGKQLLQGRQRQQPYQPIGKSLEAIGMEARIMDVMIGDEPVQCLVIPVDELMRKEWMRMGGGLANPQYIDSDEENA